MPTYRVVLLLLALGQLTARARGEQIVKERPPGTPPLRESSERPLLNTTKPSLPRAARPPPDERIVVCEDGSTRTLSDAESRPAKCWRVNERATAAVSGSPRATAREPCA